MDGRGWSGLVAAVAALSLLPHPVVADERGDLSRTRQRLGDAGAVAAALAAADRAVARSRARLATATAELDRARRWRDDAMVALEAVSDDEDRQGRRLGGQVRGAYMTGRVTGLAILVEARVRGELAEVERVRALRKQTKDKLDARVARLAGAADALRRRSAELRRLIRQEELARRRAGLGQLLLGNRILYLGQDYATTDCGRQLWAFRIYVRDRYGTAERARAFWQANGWY